MPSNMNGVPNPEAGSQEQAVTGWEEVADMAGKPVAEAAEVTEMRMAEVPEMPKDEPEMPKDEPEMKPEGSPVLESEELQAISPEETIDDDDDDESFGTIKKRPLSRNAIEMHNKAVAARMEHEGDPNYPKVFWVSDEKLSVTIGDQTDVLTAEAALEKYGDNELFKGEYDSLMAARADREARRKAGDQVDPEMKLEDPPMTPPEDLQMEKLAVDEMAVTDNEPKAGMDKLPVVDENGNEYEVDLTEAGGETQEKISDEELQAYMESIMGAREKGGTEQRAEQPKDEKTEQAPTSMAEVIAKNIHFE